MLTFLIFSYVWCLQMFLSECDDEGTTACRPGHCVSPPAVLRLSVPEDHHVCLPCGGSHGPDVHWTRGDARGRYRVQADGALCVLEMEESDGGEFGCEGRTVAELQVLTGHDFQVSAGRTLLLPCSSPSKPKQRWFHRRKGGKKVPIFTRFRNGTMKPEREGGRLSFGNDALQITNLQPEDAGEYQCNGELQVRVTVLTAFVVSVRPEPTGVQSSSSTATSPAVMKTDAVEIKKKKKIPENALLLVAVAGFVVMFLLLAAVCVLLISMKCRRKNKRRHATRHRHEDTELQSWTTTNTQTEYEVFESPSVVEETIHYASLGRRNWGERPGRTPQNPIHQDIIYSSVITTPAVRS